MLGVKFPLCGFRMALCWHKFGHNMHKHVACLHTYHNRAVASSSKVVWPYI